jgi:hypothetical protein
MTILNAYRFQVMEDDNYFGRTGTVIVFDESLAGAEHKLRAASMEVNGPDKIHYGLLDVVPMPTRETASA